MMPAAGVGERLMPLTDSRPKGLVPVRGRPLLAYSLEQLHRAGVTLLVCVTGYQADLLESTLLALPERPEIQFVRNPEFATTNSIVSLSLTSPWWDEDFCIVESDVLFTPQLIEDLLRAGGSRVVVDRSKAPTEMDVKVQILQGRVLDLHKDLPAAHSAGEFVPLARWTAEHGRQLSSAIEHLLERGQTDILWEYSVRRIAGIVPIEPLYTERGQWVEVDEPMDVTAADAFVTEVLSAGTTQVGECSGV